MDQLLWEQQPELDRPVLIAGFGGWNDAGESATSAVRYLASHWRARSFASIDAEEFFDFSETRPNVHLVDGMSRSIEWPNNGFSAASAGATGPDIILLSGTEPQLKWRTFCSAIIECATHYNARMVVTLGGLLADVPHTRPTHVTASAGNHEQLAKLHIPQSCYEGPTGIVGVLHSLCADAGIPSVSFWVAVPHYVGQITSPKATLALVQHTAELLDVAVETLELEVASAAYERQVSDVVDSDSDIAEYVAQLEASDYDENPIGLAEIGLAEIGLAEIGLVEGDALAAEAEKFLRSQNE